MKAVIVAAGFGTRLRMGPKHLVRLWGWPLSCYPLSAVSRFASETAIVVQSVYVEETRRALRECGFAPTIIANFNPHSENGYSLWLGLRWARNGPLIVSVADHVYVPEIVARLVSECNADVCVAGDTRPMLVDIDEATKIVARGSNAKLFSKSVSTFDYVDTGVFLVNNVEALEAIARWRTYLRMNDLWNEAIKAGLSIQVVDVTGLPWADVDTEADLYAFNAGARRSLIERVLQQHEQRGREVH